MPSRIEPLGLGRPRQRATWGNLLAGRHPVRDLPPDERPDNWLPPSNDVGLPPSHSSLGDELARNDGHATDGVETALLADAPARTNGTADDVASSASPMNAPARTGATAQSAADAPARTGATTEPPTDAPARIDASEMSLSGPQRYRVQFTASEEYVALVEEAKALLAHSLSNADLAEIHLRAMQALVVALKKRKYAHSERRLETAAPSASSPNNTYSPASGETPDRSQRKPDPGWPSPQHDAFEPPRKRDATQPSPQHDALEPPRKRDATQSSPQRSRHVPAAVRRAVFERDGNRCAYVDERGVRCCETHRLELHHHEPFARGGPMTPENLSLHCAAHNALAAEGDFGRQFSLEMRESRAHFSERTLARTTS